MSARPARDATELRQADEREQMFGRYEALARKLARRYSQTSIPAEDMQQVAYVGLLLAIDRFDPGRGRPFASFAIPTILGELRRHLRDHSRPVHVTRSAQERSAAVRRAQAELTVAAGRAPTAQAIAQYLEVDIEEVVDGLLARAAYDTTTFDSPAGDAEGGVTLAERLGEEDPGYAYSEDLAVLEDALAQLSERERDVLRMRYEDEMTQSRVAEQVGCSQMQISRIESGALKSMQELVHAGFDRRGSIIR